ncbi:MAG: hypothetical protein M5R36_11680 [Deltaproteobacteria bacterium]|nr:hypothetical protein [Deltaproteobacteria bacterium]
MKYQVWTVIAVALVLAVGAGCTQNQDGTSGGPSVATPAHAAALPDSETIAWVNGTPIAKAMLDEMIEQMPPFMKAQVESEEGRRKLVENIVNVELVYQAAVKDGYDKKPDVRERLERVTKQVVSAAYLDEKMKDTPEPDDEAAKKFHAENPQLADKPFDQVKPQILQMLARQNQQEIFEKITNDLKAGAEVRYNDELLKAAPAAAPEAPAETATP